MPRPVMLVIAGPPGSGKSSVFPLTAFGQDAFNIDDRCAQIVGSYRAIPRAVRNAVARECERFVRQHIVEGTTFAVETTLRTRAALIQATEARAQGFSTILRFIATGSADVNVQRVLQRAQAGGHAASETEVRTTYAASLSNLSDAVAVFERARVYDSTRNWERPRLVARAINGRVSISSDAPEWVSRILG